MLQSSSSRCMGEASGLQTDSPFCWADAGIVSNAAPWSFGVTVIGTLLGVCGFVLALPVLLVIALTSTLFELIRHLLGADPREEEAAACCASDEDVTIVLPGTCAFVFWQLGMVQYLCERFDTRGAKLAGVSSGAICAVVMLSLEEAAAEEQVGGSPEARVRQRAQEIFQVVDLRFAPVMSWPAAFVGRLGTMLDACVDECMPSNCGVGGRLRVGVRRFCAWPLPAMVPDVITGFGSREELRSAVAASSTVWLVVRPFPVSYVARKGAFCSDGVNPFSFYCFLEAAQHLRAGLMKRTAPRHTFTGVDAIYALWNAGIMRLLLPRRGRHVWATPTVGGRLKVAHCLHFSRWYCAEQWRGGYRHAMELDEAGYWHPLLRRPGTKAAAVSKKP